MRQILKTKSQYFITGDEGQNITNNNVDRVLGTSLQRGQNKQKSS